jgi:predicted kinase
MRKLSELALFVGLQASGKSSFYEAKLQATHARITSGITRRQALDAVAQALTSGVSVAVDQANLESGERAYLIDLARRHGARIVGYYFPPDAQASLRRNRHRDGNERIPDEAIYEALRRFEAPLFDEGFDEMFAVFLLDDGGFAVRSIARPGPSRRHRQPSLPSLNG